MKLRRGPTLAVLLASALLVGGVAAAGATPATGVKAEDSAKAKVPKLTNQRLDVAEALLQASHLRWKEIGGGTFGIIVKSNWFVCETLPSGGSAVPVRSVVSVVVARRGDC